MSEDATYGLAKLLHAIEYLTYRSEQSTDPRAIEILRGLSLAVVNDMDDVEIQLDIVPLDRPPEEYFGYNYDYGRVKLLHAIHYLTHRSEQSTDRQAIEILTKLSL